MPKLPSRCSDPRRGLTDELGRQLERFDGGERLDGGEAMLGIEGQHASDELGERLGAAR